VGNRIALNHLVVITRQQRPVRLFLALRDRMRSRAALSALCVRLAFTALLRLLTLLRVPKDFIRWWQCLRVCRFRRATSVRRRTHLMFKPVVQAHIQRGMRLHALHVLLVTRAPRPPTRHRLLAPLVTIRIPARPSVRNVWPVVLAQPSLVLELLSARLALVRLPVLPRARSAKLATFAPVPRQTPQLLALLDRTAQLDRLLAQSVQRE
jgi:hypothetical protein